MWPISFEKLNRPPLWLATAICTTVTLAALLLLFLTIVALGRLTTDLLGDNPSRSSEAVKSLLPIAAAAVGLPLIVWRLVILNRQTATTEAKTQIDREAHYTSIFSRSVDQLGQTREVKEAREGPDSTTLITKTVPNIEVRLGGIHSLSRLADESHRDVTKIENMLFSYVRENSWTDREGKAITRPPTFDTPEDKWSQKFRENKVDNEARGALDFWRLYLGEKAQGRQIWGGDIPDSRVDVNEAIDAVASVPHRSETLTQNFFYESLFCGRNFKSRILSVLAFERCVFVNCSFEAAGIQELRLTNCKFVNCEFEAADSFLNIDSSELTTVLFDAIKRSRISLRSARMVDCSFWGITNCRFNLDFVDLYDGWFASSEPTTVEFRAEYGSIDKGRFSNLVFTQNSTFNRCAFGDFDFVNVDLSELQSADMSNFETVRAAPNTKHPKANERPSGWPAYDATFDSRKYRPDAIG